MKNHWLGRITGRYFLCKNAVLAITSNFQRPAVPGRVVDTCGHQDFKRRPDDNEATVRDRLEVYRRDTAPIIPHYEAQGLVQRVDGMAEITEVEGAGRGHSGRVAQPSLSAVQSFANCGLSLADWTLTVCQGTSKPCAKIVAVSVLRGCRF